MSYGGHLRGPASLYSGPASDVSTHPPREETPMDTQSPRAVGNPSLGLGPIPMGIFLADLFARAPASPPPLGLHLRIADSIPYQCISEGAIGPEDWHWAMADHAPLLGALRGTVHTLSLSAYLATRDSSRALRGAPTKWAGTSARFAARLWDLSNRGIAQCGRKVRYIWDLRWHGENRASAHSDLRFFASRQTSTPAVRAIQRYTQLLFKHPNLDQRGQLWLGIASGDLADHVAACPLCGHSPCSQTHIICDCPGLTHERAGLHLDFRILTGQQARGPWSGRPCSHRTLGH